MSSTCSTQGSIRRRGFTLLELLAVVAIISVATAFTIPAVPTIYQSSCLTSNGNQLTELAGVARSYSLSHNVVTALVCVTALPSQPSVNNRAFVILSCNSSGQWSPLTGWFQTSNGIAMSGTAVNGATSFSGAYTGMYGSVNQGFPNLTLNGATAVLSAPGVCSYQLFLPDGRMDASSNPIILRLQTTYGPSNHYDLVFSPNTGTVKVDRS